MGFLGRRYRRGSPASRREKLPQAANASEGEHRTRPIRTTGRPDAHQVRLRHPHPGRRAVGMGEHQPQLAAPPIRPFRPHSLAYKRMTRVDQRHLARKTTPNVLQCVAYSKGDFGLCHAPVANFYGNWVWWHAAALAYNTARWLRVLALPETFANCRGKRLRLAFLNVAAKIVRHARRIVLRLPRAYAHAEAFTTALDRLRALPVFA